MFPAKAQTVNILGFAIHILSLSQIFNAAIAMPKLPEMVGK